jgi:peroxiredoxin
MKSIRFGRGVLPVALVLCCVLAALVSFKTASAALDGPEVGAPAPDFELPDTDGNITRLSSFRGKVVVLEWFNPDCPFVVHAHGKKGPLTEQVPRALADGVVWLAVNSGAPGKQGAGLARNIAARSQYGMTYPVLLDPTGEVGRRYGAITTPHMFVVDAEGSLVYAGGLDGAPFGRGNKNNFVDAALVDLKAGTKPQRSRSKPYGCSVKYSRN